MKLDDRDLHDALTPLAGDPAEDTARVLAALPVSPATARPWPWISVAAAAGLVIGLLWPDGSDPRIVEVAGPTVTVEVAPAPVPIVRHAIGAVVLETDGDPEPLRNGDPTRFDHVIAAAEPGSRAFVELPNGIEARLDGRTRLTVVDDRTLSLLGGRAWFRVPKAAGRWVIDTVDGVITASPGTYQVAAVKGATTLVVFDGEATFADNTGEENLLGSKTICSTRDGALGSVEPLKDDWRRVSWQIEALANCVDWEEAVDMAVPLAMSLSEKETHRYAAAELRRIGSTGAMALAWTLFRTEDLAGPAREAAVGLLADLADMSSLGLVLEGLQDDDGQTRGTIYEAVTRITGERERDRGFWETASQAERYDALQRLRGKLRDF